MFGITAWASGPDSEEACKQKAEQVTGGQQEKLQIQNKCLRDEAVKECKDENNAAGIAMRKCVAQVLIKEYAEEGSNPQ